MELRELVTFVAVAEAGSLRVAAERLHLSQPAVTRRIQRLEQSLGLALVDHRTRPVALTSAGRAFLERCRHAVTVISELRSQAPTVRETRTDCRLGVVSSLADLVLPGLAVALAEECPRLAVHFSIAWSRSLVNELRSGNLDAAIVYAPDLPAPPANLLGERLLRLPISIVESRRRGRTSGYGRRSMQPAELDGQRWLVNPEGCCFRTALSRMLDHHGASMRLALEVSGVHRQLSMVAHGFGLGFVPEPVFRGSPLSARLRAVHVPGGGVRVPVWIMHRSAGPALEPAIRHLASHVRRRLRATASR
jgi:DNA-binding transcriptional LysR family regulator